MQNESDDFVVLHRGVDKTVLRVGGEVFELSLQGSEVIIKGDSGTFKLFKSGRFHNDGKNWTGNPLKWLEQPSAKNEDKPVGPGDEPKVHQLDSPHTLSGKAGRDIKRVLGERLRAQADVAALNDPEGLRTRTLSAAAAFKDRKGLAVEKRLSSKARGALRKELEELYPDRLDEIDRLMALAEQTSAVKGRFTAKSEELGMIAARDIARSRKEHIIVGGEDSDTTKNGKKRGANTLDLVSVSADGSRLRVYESKGGSASLSRDPVEIPDPADPTKKIYVRQGSKRYLQHKLQQDELLMENLLASDNAAHHELWRKIRAGTADIDYELVSVDEKGTLTHKKLDIGDQPTGFLIPQHGTPPTSGPQRGRPRGRRAVATVALVAGLAMAPLFGGALTGRAPAANATVVQADGDLSRALQAHAKDSTSAAGALRKFVDAARDGVGAHKDSADASKSSAEGSKGFYSLLGKSAGVFGIAAKAIEAWSIVQQALNLVMRANPFGAIITAITVAIGAITLIVENWDTIKVAMQWVWQNVLVPVGKWFSDTWNETLVPMFRASVENIGKFFSAIGDSISGIWEGIVDTVKGFLRWIADWVEKIPFIGDGMAKRIRNFTDPERKADGGLLGGSGGARTDVVPVLASNGEFIVNAASAARNMPLLDAINSGAMPAFADGGVVSHPVWGLPWAGIAAGDASVDTDVPEGRAAVRTGRSRNATARTENTRSSGSEAVTDTAAGPMVDVASPTRSLLDAALREPTVGRLSLPKGFDRGGAVAVSDAPATGVELGGTGWNPPADTATEMYLAAGGFAGDTGSTGGFAATDPLLRLIGRDAAALTNVRGGQSIPTRPLGTRRARRNTRIDRSLAIHLSAPDVDAEFMRNKADTRQRALTYSGRWI
ncbi:hypothetical protein [Nocardia sp. NPDC051570]|uniref:hypothetical protein n=1 Tax=Nocardia sp. NPDC051570 TaxID=3364324 RepID=UPI00379C0B30